MASDLSLTLQTIYAELLDRAASAAFDQAFAEAGDFTPKTVRGRRYWYFQETGKDGARRQRYAGPETPELLERIRRHRDVRDDRKDRRALVSALLRSAHLRRTDRKTGEVVAALAEAGVFRLRGVLVGTVAYQTYSASLGARLSDHAIQTDDIDIAQFGDISIAVAEKLPSMIEVLKRADPSFEAVPHSSDRRAVSTYRTRSGKLRVDFLTPNVGSDTDRPRELPALGTDAQPLRFLDFLIREPERAVLLHDDGVSVLVPSPQRYAVHKLIVARRRIQNKIKAEKDIRQAEALLDALADKRPHELREAWDDAFARGKKWQRLMGEGLGRIEAGIRDRTLKTVGATRSVVPDLDLTFAAPPPRYDVDRDIVEVVASSGGEMLRCAIGREALEDHFGGDGTEGPSLVKIVRDNRAAVEAMARKKYLTWPVEETGAVLIQTGDVESLRRRTAKT